MIILVVLWGLTMRKKGSLVLTQTFALISTEGDVPCLRVVFLLKFRRHLCDQE